MDANFWMFRLAWPKLAPVTPFAAPSPTGPAVGRPSQIGKLVLRAFVLRASPASWMAPVSTRIPLTRISPCSGGRRYAPEAFSTPLSGMWLDTYFPFASEMERVTGFTPSRLRTEVWREVNHHTPIPFGGVNEEPTDRPS